MILSLLLGMINHMPIRTKSAIYALLYRRGICPFSIYNGESFHILLNDALSVNKKRTNIDYSRDKALLVDIFYCYFKFHVKPGEYFNFEFSEKTDSQRAEYICDEDRVRLLERINGLERKFELRDKYEFFKLAKPFFKRKVFHLDKTSDIQQFLDFALSVEKLFCKPNKGAMGVGISSHVISSKADAETLYTNLMATASDWIIEETIEQGQELNEWNDTSINTVRFPSFLRNGKFTIYYPKLRVGRKGQIVDNFAQGGMIAMIEGETGKIITDAYTKSNEIYKSHPDSNKKFKGEIIPEWESLLSYAEQLHRSMPQHIYVAWDFAYTKNGWDIVEANWGQLGSTQMMLKRGVRKEFYNLLGINE